MTAISCISKRRWNRRPLIIGSWLKRWSDQGNAASRRREGGRVRQIHKKDMKASKEDIQAWGQSLDGSDPQSVLAAAVARYRPRIILACSFGAEDVVLVDMLHRIDPS